MSLLIDSYREAPGKVDNVRSHKHTSFCVLLSDLPRLCTANRLLQGKKMSLHHAAMNGAPFDVTELLLDAYREAVAAADEARSAYTMPPTYCRPAVAAPSPSSNATVLHHTPCAQEAKMPLHHAAAKGAPIDVIKLLLDANPEAATTVAQARCSVHTTTPMLPLPLRRSTRGTPLPLLDPCGLALQHLYTIYTRPHRTGSSPCTTLPPGARRSV